MRAKKIFITAILFLSGFSFSYSQTPNNFSGGLNAAKSSGKKIFIDIYSASDSWSKKMDTDIYSSPEVQSALSGFIFVKLNAGGAEKFNYQKKEYSSSELAKFFGGTGYPTFVFLNSDGSIIKFKYNGEETSSISGFLGKDDFVELLNYFAQNKYKDTDLSSIFQN